MAVPVKVACVWTNATAPSVKPILVNFRSSLENRMKANCFAGSRWKATITN